jgi:2,4-dienoyl-CoA reductase-like NADH-dependent reductase (Old Yellow Enzyme family)
MTRTSRSEAVAADRTAGSPLLMQPFTLRDLRLRNRIVVSPMCQYSCDRRDGLATDWHLVHLGSRAVGGAGLVLAEASAVTVDGRITPEDLGFWSDAHAAALEPIVRFVQAQGAAVGIQLAHAGRKASTTRPWEGGTGLADADGGWTPLAPSAIPFSDTYRAPRAMNDDDIRAVTLAFADAARRADAIGMDVIELHAAHGYLLHTFLSPLSNQRTDGYGGSFENRARFVLEVVDAVRAAWPEHKPLMVRISATDWIGGGWDIDDSVRLAGLLEQHGVDLIDCSSAGVAPAQQIPVGPGYQVPFAERIRRDVGMPTAAVGLITAASQAEEILAEGRADLILMAREHLRDPYFALHAAAELGAADALAWPDQYLRAAPPR